MTSIDIKRAFHDSTCGEIELTSDGTDKFIVHTPFMFDDGDHFVIVMKKRSDEEWIFTDEGHTLMHLSYGGFKITPSRAVLIDGILLAVNASNHEGELTLRIIEDQIGSALFGFAQMLTRVTEAAKWTREHVRSTFLDDFQDLLLSVIPQNRLYFGHTDPAHDPDGKYVVDCKVNGMPRPLYVFAVGTTLKCKDATIAIHMLKSWNPDFDSMAIFEDQQHISRPTLARFSDVVDKQFSSIGAKQEIAEYLERHVPGLLTS